MSNFVQTNVQIADPRGATQAPRGAAAYDSYAEAEKLGVLDKTVLTISVLIDLQRHLR